VSKEEEATRWRVPASAWPMCGGIPAAMQAADARTPGCPYSCCVLILLILSRADHPDVERGTGIPTQSVEPVVKHALPLAHSTMSACLAVGHGSGDEHAERGMACS
jgi:hypothetical protein